MVSGLVHQSCSVRATTGDHYPYKNYQPAQNIFFFKIVFLNSLITLSFYDANINDFICYAPRGRFSVNGHYSQLLGR